MLLLTIKKNKRFNKYIKIADERGVSTGEPSSPAQISLARALKAVLAINKDFEPSIVVSVKLNNK